MPNTYNFINVAKEYASKNGIKLIGPVGHGAFKETYHCQGHTGDLAIKILDPRKADLLRSQREIDAMRQCGKMYFAEFHGKEDFEYLGLTYFIFTEEFLSEGTLADKGTPLSKDLVREYALNLSLAIDVLKQNNLVHRDIKPENIMFRNGRPLLVDFGLVRDLKQESLTQTFIPQGPCTPYFASPEQLNNDKAMIGWRSDQFCLGIVLGILLTGEHPYKRDSVLKTKYAVAGRERCSDDFKKKAANSDMDFILKMIEPWPNRRFCKAEEMISAIRGD